MHGVAAELSSFADLLARVSQASRHDAALPNRELQDALVRLGFEPTRHVVALLASLRIHRVAPLHLDLVRKLAADPVALRRLEGASLDEFMLDLMGFERVRPLLTRRFFKTHRYRCEQEESLWWAAAHLQRALQASSIKVRRIDSVSQLLRAGEHAKQALSLAGVSVMLQQPSTKRKRPRRYRSSRSLRSQ